MKKIMFNDRYGLTWSVLKGKKTMTRRLFKAPLAEFNDINYSLRDSVNANANRKAIIKKYAQYQVGQVLAVAQSYKHINEDMMDDFYNPIYDAFKEADEEDIVTSSGWDNKMFVSADIMPHQIKITDVKLERLQDIDEEQATREGIQTDTKHFTVYQGQHGFYDLNVEHPWLFQSPRLAFMDLIDRISGKGTWQSNPYVFAYTFKLIR